MEDGYSFGMDVNTTLHRPTDEEGRSRQFGLVRGAIYIGAALAGIGAGINKIWDMFYDNFKDYPAVKQLREDRHTQQRELCIEAEAKPMGRHTFLKRYRAIENDFGHKFNDTLLKNFEIESEGVAGAIKGTWHRFQALGKYTQTKIAFGAIASTTAAVGGLVLVEYLITRPSGSHAANVEASKTSADAPQR